MSRKTVPLLIISIAILLIALIAIIVVMMSTPERRQARQYRNGAMNTLLSRSLDDHNDDSLNLYLITASLTKPLTVGGSLDNLDRNFGAL